MEEVGEILFDAKRELKRVDHLIYVSLKYTRTVDVLKSVVERLINAFDLMVDALLFELKTRGRIAEAPKSPGLKCDVIKEKIKDEKILELVEFYMLLRTIIRAKYTSREEYKRHVTLIADIGKEKVDVHIDSVTHYYKEALGYLEYITKFIEEMK